MNSNGRFLFFKRLSKAQGLITDSSRVAEQWTIYWRLGFTRTKNGHRGQNGGWGQSYFSDAATFRVLSWVVNGNQVSASHLWQCPICPGIKENATYEFGQIWTVRGRESMEALKQ